MKRDNWTNEEVIDILEGMKIVDQNGAPKDSDRNLMLDLAISLFYDFKRSPDEYTAMAYEPDTKEIVVIGTPLPR
jgi:hypothetical protein